MKLLLLSLLIASFTVVSCDQDPQPELENDVDLETQVELEVDGTIDPDTEIDPNIEKVYNDTMLPFSHKLEIMKLESMNRMSPEKIQAYEEGVIKLMESGKIDKILQVGDKAPDFTLTNQDGEQVQLYDKLKNNRIALVWYRGGWCPYCNLTLREYANLNDQFKQKGIEVLAISPEVPDSVKATASENNLPFDVVSDKGNKVADKYKLTYTVTPEVKSWYDKGFGMAKYNADDSGKLPLAGTYIIGKDGKIIDAYFLPDYRHRISPKDILKTL